MNPYTLPEGNTQIAFSGGRSSAYMLDKILDANNGLPDTAKAVFTNTGRERPETLDFVERYSRERGVEIIWLEYRYDNAPRAVRVCRETASLNGEPFRALCERRKALPNQNARFCTEELKVKTARRWLVMQGWKRWTKFTGIRADELSRHNPKPQPRETILQPMAKAGVTKRDVAAFWKAQPFDLELPIVKGKTLGGNCRKCFLKSEATVAAEIRDDPNDTWPDEMEDRFGVTFSSRYSHKELRRYINRQGDWIFDDADYLCQADGGECFG